MLAARRGSTARRITVAPAPAPVLLQHKGIVLSNATSPASLVFDNPIAQGSLVVLVARSAEAFTGGAFMNDYAAAVTGTDSEVGQVLYQRYKIAGASESSTITIEDNDGIINGSVHGLVFSNMAQTSVLDKAPAPNDEVGTGVVGNAPSTGTLSQNVEVAVAGVAANASVGTYGTVPTGFTYVGSGLHTTALFAYSITTTNAALAPQFTWTSARHRITGIATYKGA